MRYGLMLALCGLVFGCSKSEPVAPTGNATEAPAAPAGEAPKPAEAAKMEAPAEKAEAPKPAVGTAPAVLAALSAEHTVAVGGIEGLDGFARQASAVLDALPADLKAKMDPDLPSGFEGVIVKLGFDPRVAEAWATVGLDPKAGVALVVDDRLMTQAGLPWPVALARITDRGKLVAALGKIGPGFELGLPETDGIARLKTPEGGALLGVRGDFTAVMAAPETDEMAKAARAAFADWLKADDAPLSGVEALAPSLKLPGAARGFAVALTGPLLKLVPQAVAPVFAEFYQARFPALSMAVGADLKSGQLRLQADPAAVAALRQVLVSPHRPPAFDRFVPADGVAVGFSINPVQLFDGVVALIPPARGDVQGQVLIGKNAVPVLLGVSLDDLAQAFSGHIAMILPAEAMKSVGEKPLVVALGIHDGKVLDRILPVALDRLASQSGGEGRREPTKFGALEGFVLQGGEPTFVVRSGDTLLLGPSRAGIEAALDRETKPGETGRLSFADGGFYTVSVPLALIDTLAADMPPDVTEAFQMARQFWTSRLGPHLKMPMRVDDQGVTADGPAAAMMVGVGTAVAIPAFVKYINRSKAAMARLHLGRLFAAASLAGMDGRSLKAAPLTPAADPCADGGDGTYEASATTWSHPTWKALGFAPTGALYYRFAFEPGEGQGFTIRAVGDLDCDGKQAVYEQSTDAEGQRQPDVERDPLE